MLEKCLNPARVGVSSIKSAKHNLGKQIHFSAESCSFSPPPPPLAAGQAHMTQCPYSWRILASVQKCFSHGRRLAGQPSLIRRRCRCCLLTLVSFSRFPGEACVSGNWTGRNVGCGRITPMQVYLPADLKIFLDLPSLEAMSPPGNSIATPLFGPIQVVPCLKLCLDFLLHHQLQVASSEEPGWIRPKIIFAHHPAFLSNGEASQ